jgi:hypothetical protein
VQRTVTRQRTHVVAFRCQAKRDKPLSLQPRPPGVPVSARPFPPSPSAPLRGWRWFPRAGQPTRPRSHEMLRAHAIFYNFSLPHSCPFHRNDLDREPLDPCAPRPSEIVFCTYSFLKRHVASPVNPLTPDRDFVPCACAFSAKVRAVCGEGLVAREEPTRARLTSVPPGSFVLPERWKGTGTTTTRPVQVTTSQGHAASTVHRLLGYLGKTSPRQGRPVVTSSYLC